LNEGRAAMPTIAYFYGIAIRMYYLDHPPPHFSAQYGGHEANISIQTGEIIDGGPVTISLSSESKEQMNDQDQNGSSPRRLQIET
jgi:hypothetical protein